ncbi:hypothetical protein ACFQ0M_14495 [Kitasatospora aburaviensis]
MRSDRNYGHLVAAALKAANYTDVTCAAAKVKAMTQAQYDAFIRVNDPQLDAVTADTDLVTLGIGGNDLGVTDLGLGDLVATCIAGAVVNPLGTPARTSSTTATGTGPAGPGSTATTTWPTGSRRPGRRSPTC